MKIRPTTVFCSLLVVLALSSLSVNAHADTVSELTGHFVFDSANGSLGSHNWGYVWTPPNGLFDFSVVLPTESLEKAETCMDPPTCYIHQIVWEGPALSGTVSWTNLNNSASSTTFAGWMTSSDISVWEMWDDRGGWDGVYEYGLDFTFRGVWSNGWWAEGSTVALTHTTGSTDGYFDMTTSTPEPDSLVLFASGALCIGKMLRRKLASSR